MVKIKLPERGVRYEREGRKRWMTVRREGHFEKKVKSNLSRQGRRYGRGRQRVSMGLVTIPDSK